MAMKKHIGAKLSPDLVESIRNAAWHIGQGWSLNKVLEDGAKLELERLEAENGGVFPDREEGGPPPAKSARTGQAKATVTWRMYVEDQTRLKNASAALGVSLTSIVEAGAHKVLETLQKKYNKGKPFKQRTGDLPGATPRE